MSIPNGPYYFLVAMWAVFTAAQFLPDKRKNKLKFKKEMRRK